MKKLYLILVLGLAVGIVCWAFGPSMINAKGKEVKVNLADVPVAVRATLEKEAPGAEIEEIEMEEEDGKVVYEADVKIDGKEFELKIAADGTVLKKEAEEEDEKEGKDRDDDEEEDEGQQVSIGDLPEAVKATLAKEAPGAPIEEIEMEEEDGKVVYGIEVEIDGQEYELEIAADGTLLEKEADEGKDDDGDDEDDNEDED